VGRRRGDDGDLSPGPKFLNDPRDVVEEMLEGFLRTHTRLVRREGEARVLSRAVPSPDTVGVIAGGGSGHEPALLGYVGSGLLDAVVVGDVFASPPAGDVVEAIRRVDTGRGVLLLIGNYAGDVLNFEMAQELAREQGHDVALEIVTADVATPEAGGRRGLSGSFFVWKAAGAAAARGDDLEDVRRVARETIGATRTMGVASRPGRLPGSEHATFEVVDGQVEVGVGHGEPGLRREPMRAVDELVDGLVEDLWSFEPAGGLGGDVATLVNGFGGTPLMELYVAQRRLLRELDRRGVAVHRSYVGNVYTALEMAGFSIALLGLDEERRALIDAPAEAPHFAQGAPP
jgi:phosphoenolpyruvate---glycerone phosphotransferase subunit DhaK